MKVTKKKSTAAMETKKNFAKSKEAATVVVPTKKSVKKSKETATVAVPMKENVKKSQKATTVAAPMKKTATKSPEVISPVTEESNRPQWTATRTGRNTAKLLQRLRLMKLKNKRAIGRLVPENEPKTAEPPIKIKIEIKEEIIEIEDDHVEVVAKPDVTVTTGGAKNKLKRNKAGPASMKMKKQLRNGGETTTGTPNLSALKAAKKAQIVQNSLCEIKKTLANKAAITKKCDTDGSTGSSSKKRWLQALTTKSYVVDESAIVEQLWAKQNLTESPTKDAPNCPAFQIQTKLVFKQKPGPLKSKGKCDVVPIDVSPKAQPCKRGRKKQVIEETTQHSTVEHPKSSQNTNDDSVEEIESASPSPKSARLIKKQSKKETPQKVPKGKLKPSWAVKRKQKKTDPVTTTAEVHLVQCNEDIVVVDALSDHHDEQTPTRIYSSSTEEETTVASDTEQAKLNRALETKSCQRKLTKKKQLKKQMDTFGDTEDMISIEDPGVTDKAMKKVTADSLSSKVRLEQEEAKINAMIAASGMAKMKRLVIEIEQMPVIQSAGDISRLVQCAKKGRKRIGPKCKQSYKRAKQAQSESDTESETCVVVPDSIQEAADDDNQYKSGRDDEETCPITDEDSDIGVPCKRDLQPLKDASDEDSDCYSDGDISLADLKAKKVDKLGESKGNKKIATAQMPQPPDDHTFQSETDCDVPIPKRKRGRPKKEKKTIKHELNEDEPLYQIKAKVKEEPPASCGMERGTSSLDTDIGLKRKVKCNAQCSLGKLNCTEVKQEPASEPSNSETMVSDRDISPRKLAYNKDAQSGKRLIDTIKEEPLSVTQGEDVDENANRKTITKKIKEEILCETNDTAREHSAKEEEMVNHFNISEKMKATSKVIRLRRMPILKAKRTKMRILFHKFTWKSKVHKQTALSEEETIADEKLETANVQRKRLEYVNTAPSLESTSSTQIGTGAQLELVDTQNGSNWTEEATQKTVISASPSTNGHSESSAKAAMCLVPYDDDECEETDDEEDQATSLTSLGRRCRNDKAPPTPYWNTVYNANEAVAGGYSDDQETEDDTADTVAGNYSEERDAEYNTNKTASEDDEDTVDYTNETTTNAYVEEQDTMGKTNESTAGMHQDDASGATEENLPTTEQSGSDDDDETASGSDEDETSTADPTPPENIEQTETRHSEDEGSSDETQEQEEDKDEEEQTHPGDHGERSDAQSPVLIPKTPVPDDGSTEEEVSHPDIGSGEDSITSRSTETSRPGLASPDDPSSPIGKSASEAILSSFQIPPLVFP